MILKVMITERREKRRRKILKRFPILIVMTVVITMMIERGGAKDMFHHYQIVVRVLYSVMEPPLGNSKILHQLSMRKQKVN